MAIDKIFPKSLNTDSEERVLKEGSMTDAMNITIAEDGGGTSAIAKNVRGTIPGEPLSDTDGVLNNKRIVAIGSASDSQRGFIYYIVADASGSLNENEHAIYQYNVTNDTYRVVLKDSRFNFDPTSFVKIDVVNGDFARSGGLQTVLFFTDNINPPRKINVDRAIGGEYSDISQREFDYSLNCIKAPNVYEPIASFTTDKNIDTNLFRDEAFQFATQIVYKDGEESAISPYSKLIIPTQLTVHNINEIGFGLGYNVDNVCLIDPNLSSENFLSSPDVSKIRFLFRSGNNGAFNISDELDLNTPTSRTINGSVIQIFNGVSNYRFYNDRVVTSVAPAEVNKLFDNVPFEAKGQAVSGNRLMYSNYTEGRENTKVDANLSVVYRGSNLTRKEYVSQLDLDPDIGLDGFSDVVSTGVTSNPAISSLSIDLPTMMGISPSDAETTIISAGTAVNFSFYWSAKPQGIIMGEEGAPLCFISFIADNDPDLAIDSITFGELGLVDPLIPENYDGNFGGLNGIDPFTEDILDILPKFELSFIVPVDMPFFLEGEQNFINFFQAQLEEETFTPRYEVTFGTSDSPDDFQFSLGDTFGGVGLLQDLKNPRMILGFQNQSIDTSLTINTFVIPKGIFFEYQVFSGSQFDPPVVDISVISYFTNEAQPLFVASGFTLTPDSFPPISDQLDYLTGKELSVVERSQISGFKSGALHNLGVVYYDKFNRSSFVNEIGNVYVEWFNKDGNNFRGDKTDPENYLDGPAAIEVKVSSTPPEWAETYQMVYPGNSSVSDFVQYTIGGCFPARVKKADDQATENDFPNRDIDTQSKRLYVSLETLDQYRSERNTFRDYSYTEGDKLRVISLKNEIGSSISIETDEDDLESIYKGASDGTIIEFDVVGVELLAKDVDNPISFNPNGAFIPGSVSAYTKDYFTGKFLVLEASSIAAGAFGEDGAILRYPGFDWNHVSAYYRSSTATQGSADVNQADFDYISVNDEAPTPVNSWRQRSVVEIFTPRLSIENKFYYEIGERRNILSGFSPGSEGDNPVPNPPHGGPFILDSGDINYRPVPCKTLFFNEDAENANASFKDEFKDFVYKLESLESFTVSDKIGENMWNQGRPHVKYDNAATFRRFNGVTYSDAYAEDVDRLSLVSFNATLANFYSLDSQYGACNYISNYGSEQRGFDELLSIQENKFSKTPVNKSILLDASGANNLALSTNVLTTTTYYTGDYGCGDHPESVLVQDNDVYFFDRSRKKVLRFSGNQLVPISDNGVSSTVNDATDAFNKVFDRKSGKVVSGYNPDDNVYYITFHYPQDFSYKSGEDIKLVPLYTTTDLNQDGIPNEDDLNIFVNTYDQVAAGDITSNEAAELYTTTTDISFEALDPENPDVFTLSNAATIDISSIGPDPTTPQDGLANVNDLLTFLMYYGVTAPITAEINGATYIQYVNILDADGDPIPALFNGQPMFVNVDTNEVVFSNNEPIQGTEIPYSTPQEYRDFITLSYNAEGNFWQSRNSYYPDIYANQDNKMYTAKYVIDSDHPSPSIDGNALMFHRHEDLKTAGDTILNRCTFYNQPTSESFIELVSNVSPSSAKVYDALSYEGDSAKLTARIESFLGNEKGIANIPQTAFTKKEGSYYSAIGGDISENSTNQIRLLGYVLEVGESQITINDAPAGAVQGAVLKTVDDLGVLFDIGVDGEEVLIQGDITTVDNGVTVDLNGPVDESVVNTTIVMELPRDRNGDSIRGHYAKIKLSTNEGENVGKYELFCVNAHVTPSDLHHIN